MVGESRISYLPFQVGRNFAHQEMSFLASEFKEIRWDNLSTVVDKSMRRLINIRPDGITLEANESFPINESRSLLVHFFKFDHFCSIATRADSLSSGNLSDIVCESISIPRNVSLVSGPTIFSGAKGTPKLLNRDIVFRNSS